VPGQGVSGGDDSGGVPSGQSAWSWPASAAPPAPAPPSLPRGRGRPRWALPLLTIVVVAVIALAVGLSQVIGNGTVDQKLAIRGAPGYTTFTGPQGKPMAAGRPWGTVCQPVVFSVAPAVPATLYQQIGVVVLEARASGIDVAVENRQFYWRPADLYPRGLTNAGVKFVPVFANTTSSPRFADGKPEHIVFGWDARPAADREHEVLTSLEGVFYLKNLDDAAAYRSAMRRFVAFSQGVAASTAPGSGIAEGTAVDSFSSADVAAMLRMSGCHLHP